MLIKRRSKNPFESKSYKPDASGWGKDETGTRKFYLLPWLKGYMAGKGEQSDWSKSTNEEFDNAVKKAEDIEMVEQKMSLLNPDIDDMDSGDEEGAELAKLNEDFGVWDEDEAGDKTISELHQEYLDAIPQTDTAGLNQFDLIAEQNLNQRQASTDADALVQSYKGSVYDTDTPDMITQDSSEGGSKISPATAIKAAGLLNDILNPPQDPLPQMQSAGIHAGKIPFPSLLAMSERKREPRYVNKGLI